MLQQALEQQLFGAASPVLLGRFSVLELLGKGGMGAVYAAYDPDLDRRVAVKVLHSRAARGPQSAARLRREAQALARLSHPHVITVHEVGVHEGRVFVAMEYVQGGTLETWGASLEPGRARFAAICERLRECVDGLAAAHEAGLVHRDFKPANVLIDDRGRARVADFGLVRIADATSEPAGPGRPPADTIDNLTQTAQFVGTPSYMAPEQFEGRADERSDQFALCVTFFEILYGVRPFTGTTPAELALGIQDGVLEPPDAPDVPDWMFAIIARGLRVDPAQRFANLGAMRAALRRGTRRRRWAPALGALGLSATAITVAWPRSTPAVSADAGVHCSDGRDMLETVWGEPRRTTVRAAFEATGHGSQRELWERVDARLSAWGDEWSAATLASCEATNLRRTQPDEMHRLRTRCMLRLRDSVAGLTEGYASITPDTIGQTAKTSLRLPDITRCAERNNLIFAKGRLDLASPAVEAFMELASTYQTLARQGLGAQAELFAYEAALHAQDNGLPRLASQAYRSLSAMMHRAGDGDEADATAKRALEQAQRSGQANDVVLAWLQLATIAGAFGTSDKQAFYLARASATAQGFEVSEVTLAKLQRAQASRALAAADNDRAAELYLQSFATFDRRRVHPDQAAACLSSASLALFHGGRVAEAFEVGRNALTMLGDLLGAWSAEALDSAFQLARFHVETGRMAKALELTRDAIGNIPANADRQWRLRARSIAAELLVAAGDPQTGIARFEELVDHAPSLGERSPVARQMHLRHAVALLRLGRYSESEARFDALLAAERELPILPPADEATAALHYASLLAKTDRATDALRHLERANELGPEVVRTPSSRVHAALIAGEILARAGEPERARERFEGGLHAAQSTTADPALVAEIQAQLAAL